MDFHDDVTQNIKTIKTIPLQLKGNYPAKFDIREILAICWF
jgi:DNA ligase (NAD+)